VSGGSWEVSLDGGGSWSAGSGSTFVMPEGSYGAAAVRVRQTDVAGNVSGENTSFAALVVDQTAPVPVITAIGSSGVVRGTRKGLILQGRDADPNQPVEIRAGGTLLATAMANPRGRFQLQLSGAQIEQIGQGGGKRFSAAQLDGAGNRGVSPEVVAAVNTRAATSQFDRLTGARGEADLFRWQRLGHSRALKADVITNYEPEDQLVFQGLRFNTSLDSSLGRIAEPSRTQLQALLSKQALPAGSARAFEVQGFAGTYVAMNDQRPGFNFRKDALVWLDGYRVGIDGVVQIV